MSSHQDDFEENPLDQEIGNSLEQDQEADDIELSETEQKEVKNTKMKKYIIGIILVAFVTFVIVDTATNRFIASGTESFLEWVEDNPIPGFFLFVVVYFAATVLFVPGAILTLGAGFVFGAAFGLGGGLVIGTLSVVIGASSGAIVSFLIGRFLLRDWVMNLTMKYAIFKALDVALEEKGLRIMTLLRLSPIIPFNAINYIMGVTSISLLHYTIALIAIIPGTILFVFLGVSAGSLTDSMSSNDDPTVTIIIVVVGILFGVLAILLTSYYAKIELNKVLAMREEEEVTGVQDGDTIEIVTTDDLEANETVVQEKC
jgi:uncharacterized membrane protein YdjX (TVP38/TMEM64 family)|mmetsp:Transcript_13903/g.18222  ORF Transcript_13903/g.18222 Transcript_13903/m.18222 type:complete len:315 (-) Transcript_13903:160-1104(-)